MRLVGGQSENEGRVEVCIYGRWGTVTDDGWSTTDGGIVCRQLGYSSAGTYVISIYMHAACASEYSILLCRSEHL